MKKRLYTSCVLEKVTLQDGKIGWVKVSDADSGTEALKQVREFAENNANRAFCACNMWPAVMTRAITTFVYVDPENPDKLLKDVPGDEDDGEDDEVIVVSAMGTDTVVAPVAVPTPEPEKAVKVEAPKVETPKVETPKVEAPKAEAPKADNKVEKKAEKKAEPKADSDDDFEALFKNDSEPADFANSEEDDNGKKSPGSSLPELF